MAETAKPLLVLRGPAGIPVHVTLGSVLFYLACGLFGAVVMGTWLSIIGIPLLFLIAVAAHEAGHAWVAHQQGATVNHVSLNFGGGRCDYADGTVSGGLWVALGGPLANVALAVLVCVVMVASLTVAMLFGVNPGLGLAWDVVVWLTVFMVINLGLAALNMFPFLPLDGGLALQFLLMRWWPPLRVQRIVGWIGLIGGVIWIAAMVVVFWRWAIPVPVWPSPLLHWRMARADVYDHGVIRLDGDELPA